MISKTILALIAAIIVIAAAGVAVVTLTGGDDTPETPTVPGGDDESPDAPEETPGDDEDEETPGEDAPAGDNYVDRLRDDQTLRVGDTITQSISAAGMYEFTRTYTVTSVSGDNVGVTVTDIDGTREHTYTKQMFLDQMYNLVGVQLDLSNKIGTATIPTFAGQVSCGTYLMNIAGNSLTVWISEDTDVMYKAQMFFSSGAGGAMEMNYELLGSTLLETE